MKKTFSVFIILFFLISLNSCSTTGESTGLGALIGAATGAAAGYLATGNAKGALIGPCSLIPSS